MINPESDERNWLRDKIKEYKKNNNSDPVSIGEANRLLDFMAENEDCFCRTNQKGHITGSSWIFNEDLTQVLLHHHRKIDQWIQLGGHSDGDSNTLNVAIRESEEESGLMDLKVLSEEIFDIDIHLFPAKGDEPEHLHYDVRFLLQGSVSKKLYISQDESKDISWVPLKKVFIDDKFRLVRKLAIKSLDYISEVTV